MRGWRFNSAEHYENLSAVFFLLLFPGFYFYHQALAAGLISGFIGGFFSPVCLLALLLYTPFLKHIFKIITSRPLYALILVSFLVWGVGVAIANLLLNDAPYVRSAFIQHASTVLNWVALVLVGMGINFRISWFRKYLWLALIIMTAMLTYHVISTGTLQYYAAKLYGVEEGVASYQGFARSALILAFSIFALSKKLTTQVLVVVCSVFVLFVLAARSEFVALLISIVAFFMLRSRVELSKLMLIVGFLLIGVLAITLYSDMIMESRQAGLFNLASDTSWSARQEKMDDAIARISDSPLLGNFGGHFEYGSGGDYSHNIISAWDAYGLLGFLLYIILCLKPFLYSVNRTLLSSSLDSLSIFTVLLAFSVIVLVVGAKSVFWPIPAILWGVYINSPRREAETT